METNRKTVFITLLLLTLLLGCNGTHIENTEIPPKKATSIPFISPIPSATLTLIPSLNQTPTPSVALIPIQHYAEFESSCPNIQDSLTAGFLANGKILLYKPATKGFGELLSLTSRGEVLQPSSDFPITQGLWVSPNGNWLAYGEGDNLVFSSPDKKMILTYPWRKQWGGIQTWLGLDNVVMWHVDRVPAGVDILNIPTGKVQTFSPQLTDVFTYDRELGGVISGGFHVWKLVPDPTLTSFIYMRDHGLGETIPGIVLENVKDMNTLWEIRRFTPGDGDVPPIWSPDGKWLALSSWDYFPQEQTYHLEVFTVSRDGQVIQWVDIKNITTDIEKENIRADFAWSLDGQYLAFHGKSLYLIDISKNKVLDLCIHNTQKVIWSPDSKQIISVQNDTPSMIIDLEKNVAEPLVEDSNIFPFGWLKIP